ncbi:MAG: hypothetical protein CSA96_10335 [Bacteroidetes bacterium]|nr:MAG: hypothetical protein CSA96_10335 [Bacteroidota bacterium]
MKGRLIAGFCIILFPVLLAGQEADSLGQYMLRDSSLNYRPADTLRLYSQSDSLGLQADSLGIPAAGPALNTFDPGHSPRKAVMYALVLPGLGQAYNKKYFKIPLVYGAFAGVGYAINFNTREYQQAVKAYKLEPGDDRIVAYWRSNMELSYIALVIVYALQVLDAYVDAQLYNWDVNDELSMRLLPSIRPLDHPGSFGAPVYGLSCRFALKRH